jgi:hypothetical protein
MSNLVDYLFPLRDVSIFAVGAYFIKHMIDKREKRSLESYKTELDKQLEDHKAKLNREIEERKSEITRSLEEYKARLDTKLEEHKAGLVFLNQKLATLHSERFEKIVKLHKLFRELFSAMLKWTKEYAIEAFANESERQKVEKTLLMETAKAFVHCHNYLLENKMYFNNALSDRLMEIKKDLFDIKNDMFFGLAYREMSEGDPVIKIREAGKIINASQAIVDKLPKYMEELENEFRKILGSDN